MKVVTLLFASFAILLSQVVAREFDYCYAFDQDPYLLMGTKTAYQFVYGRTRLQPVPNCMPVQIWILSRHGSRYPGIKSVTKLLTLPKLRDQIIYNHETRGNGRLCNADLEYLRNWQPNRNLNETMADFLTRQGEQDMLLLAKRLQSEFPEVLRPLDPNNINSQNYKFRSTQTQRTQASLEAFMTGLFNSTHAVPVDPPPMNDTLLQLYKNCPAWENSVNNDHTYMEVEKFMGGLEYQNLLQNVSRRLGFAYKINNDSVRLMYDMCRYEKAWEVNNLSAWCSIFSKDELKILEYLEDLQYYYESGPGREINGKLGCPLLQDMFKHFQNLERGNFGSEPKGIFYFTHTTTISAFMTALGIGKDSTPLLANNYHSMERRHFRTSILGPFATNLVAVFYRCSDPLSPNKVMFYSNEIPVLLDGCSVGLCDWNYLKEKFGKTANECSLDFCYKTNAAAGFYNSGIVYILMAGLVAVRLLFTL